MNHYIATKIALLDIEACHPCVCSPSAAALQRNLPKLRPRHAELHGSGSGCSSRDVDERFESLEQEKEEDA